MAWRKRFRQAQTLKSFRNVLGFLKL
jgi:hypothetical protein